MLEYKIVKEYFSDDLDKEVNRMCREGWEPTGGIFCVYYPLAESFAFYQAMIRKYAKADPVVEENKWLSK